MWKYEEICEKYGNYVENMKRYVGNMWKIYGTRKNPELSPNTGSGTWRNSKFFFRLWDLDRYRVLLFYIGYETWENSGLSSSFKYNLLEVSLF